MLISIKKGTRKSECRSAILFDGNAFEAGHITKIIVRGSYRVVSAFDIKRSIVQYI